MHIKGSAPRCSLGPLASTWSEEDGYIHGIIKLEAIIFLCALSVFCGEKIMANPMPDKNRGFC